MELSFESSFKPLKTRRIGHGQEKGGLLNLLRIVRHHATTGLLNHGGRMLYISLGLEETENEIGEAIKYRFDLMKEELRTAIAQVEKIKRLAEEKGLTEVLAILNEEVEFGHDFSSPQEMLEKSEAPPMKDRSN
ncbi:MAG: hypothetical protein Q8Q95_03120 [bacterium]|nr:hypothetical protein [bacterium]